MKSALTAILALSVSAAWAATPGLDLAVAAAGHAPGAGGSFWKTDLALSNPSGETVAVEVFWLPRGGANLESQMLPLELEAFESRLLEDIVRTGFGVEQAFGALRIRSTAAIVAGARIFNDQGDAGTLGQGFDAEPLERALGPGESALVPGLRAGGEIRANFGALDVSGAGTSLRFELLAADGSVLASRDYVLEAWEPILRPIDELGLGALSSGALRVEVLSGRALAFASVVDGRSGDATTLSPGSRGDVSDGEYAARLIDASGSSGGALLVLRGGALERLELGYLNLDVVDGLGQSSCAFVFPVDRVFESTDLEMLATGLDWAEDFENPGGRLSFELTLDLDHGLGLSGSLKVTGSGFSGEFEGCNGEHPTLAVEAGKSVSGNNP